MKKALNSNPAVRKLLTELGEQLGDRAEDAIGHVIAHTPLEAPVLNLDGGAAMQPHVWYRVPLENGLTADGSPYHIYVRKGSGRKLCVFLSGGGMAWDSRSAAHPVTGGRVVAWMPNYYWSNLRPFTQIYNIGVGITDNHARINPFYDWNFIVVTYATGDLHLGRSLYRYSDESGEERVLHFHGYDNFRAAMDAGKRLFPEAEQLLIAGESAGAFAVPALSEQIADEDYPGCPDITLLSDSAMIYGDFWEQAARDVWNVQPGVLRDLQGQNLTLELYRALYRRQGERFRYLYASSVRDYLLSAFYNDVHNQQYATDEKVQRIFRVQLKTMVRELRQAVPGMGFYLYDWKRPGIARGGTIHTIIRQPEFYLHHRGKPSAARWLSCAADGHVFSVGLEKLENRFFRRTD